MSPIRVRMEAGHNAGRAQTRIGRYQGDCEAALVPTTFLSIEDAYKTASAQSTERKTVNSRPKKKPQPRRRRAPPPGKENHRRTFSRLTGADSHGSAAAAETPLRSSRAQPDSDFLDFWLPQLLPFGSAKAM